MAGYGTINEETTVELYAFESVVDPVPFKSKNSKFPDNMGWRHGGLLLLHGAIGCGLLAMPASANVAGMGAAMGIGLFVLCLSFGTTILLAYLAKETDTDVPNIEKLASHNFGEKIHHVAKAFAVLSQAFPCIIQLIAIGGLASGLAMGNSASSGSLNRFARSVISSNTTEAGRPESEWYLHPHYLMTIICTVLVLPLCLLRHIKMLKQAACLATLGKIYILGLTIAASYKKEELLNLDVLTASNSIKPNVSSLITTVTALGTSMAGFFSHHTSVANFARLKPYSLVHFTKMVALFYGISAGVYAIATYFLVSAVPKGYQMSTNIMLNLNPQHPAVIVGYVFYGLKLCLDYPTQSWAGRKKLISFVPEWFNADNRKEVQIVVAILWYAITLFIAWLVPNMITVIHAHGLLAAILGVILPGSAVIKHVLSNPEVKKVVKLAKGAAGGTLTAGGVAIIALLIVWQTYYYAHLKK